MAKKKNKNNTKSGNPNRAAQIAEQQARKAEERRQQKKVKRKRVLKAASIATAAVVVVGAVGFTVYQLLDNSGYFLHKRIAVETEHIKLTNAMLTYYYQDCVDSFMEYNTSAETQLGYQPDRSHKDQTYGDMTWYEFFLESTMKLVTPILQMCESAYAAGYTLSEEELEQIHQEAAAEDLSQYPDGMCTEDIEEAMKLRALASSYRQHYVDGIEITDEDIQKQYDDNTTDYLSWEMNCFSFAWVDSTPKDTELTKDEAEVFANDLAKCEDPASFREYVGEFLRTMRKKSEEDVTRILNSMVLKNYGSSYIDEVEQWVMQSEAEVGDTLVVDSSDLKYFQVYQLLSEPTRNDSDTVNLRTIVLSYDSYDGKEYAVQMMESLQRQFEQGGGTVEVFGDLAYQYSEDSSTYQSKGELAGYPESSTLYGEEVSEWAFSDERKPGDTIISELEDSVVFMYYESPNDLCSWQLEVYNDLYEGYMNELETDNASHQVTEHEKNMQKLDF